MSSLHAYNECSQLEWFSDRFGSAHSLVGHLKIVQRIDDGSGFAVVSEMGDNNPPLYVALANLSTFVPYGKSDDIR